MLCDSCINMAKRAWDFSIRIINKVKASSNQMGPWKVVDWQHGNFGKKISSSLSKVSHLIPLR